MPLVSVIIPVYNGEKTIRETIKSVLNQSFKDFELIIVNDGSQDATLEIVASFQAPRIKVFSYPNTGLAASRNRGISLATGEYISFIDADDMWTPDKLEAQLQALQGNPQAAVAYSWTNYIDESGKFLRRGGYINFSGDVYANLLLTNFVENGSNVLIRAQALAEVGGFDESLTAAEDLDMWYRLAARYHFVAVPSPQILYRTSVSSMSSNISRQGASCLQVIERAFSHAPQSLQYVKPYSVANISKYITHKALEGFPAQGRGLVAARFFWKAISNDPKLLPPLRDLLKIWFKIAIVTLLPSKMAEKLVNKFGTIPKIHDSILMYIRKDLLVH